MGTPQILRWHQQLLSFVGSLAPISRNISALPVFSLCSLLPSPKYGCMITALTNTTISTRTMMPKKLLSASVMLERSSLWHQEAALDLRMRNKLCYCCCTYFIYHICHFTHLLTKRILAKEQYIR